MHLRPAAMLISAMLATPAVHSQAPAPVHEVLRLTDTLYELRTKDAGYICKILASIGPDGVLLVESETKEHVPALLEELKKLGGGAPRIVINSHSHGEHWDGNVALGKTPLYIGHPNLRRTLSSGIYSFLELDEGILPRLLVSDELSLHFNGEEIRIKSFAGAHDDSDLVIWFTKSKVAFVGALATACKLPTVDGRKGDIRRYPELTRKLLAWLPEDVKLVPGHGEDATRAQGLQFLEMLEQTAAAVKEGIAKGRSLEDMQQADVLKDWASWEVSYSNRKYWLGALYDGYTGTSAARNTKASIHEAMHRAFKEKGAAGIVPTWQSLKRERDKYLMDDRSLVNMVSVLNEKRQDAAVLSTGELMLQEFPKSRYVNYVRLTLAQVHQRKGDKARAMARLKEILEVNPTHPEALQLQKQLESE